MTIKTQYKFGLIEDDEIIDAVMAYNVEEAKELFILLHGLEFLKDKKIICVPLIYCHKNSRMVNLESYYN